MGIEKKIMKLVGNSCDEGSSVIEDCSCVSENSECIILDNDGTILPPKEFLDLQRTIFEPLSHTKPTHLMSK